MWVWLWALLAVACSAAPTPRPAAPARAPVELKPEAAGPAQTVGLSRPPSPAEMRLISQLMRETERIRQLRFKRPVDVRIQDRAAMRAYVSRAIHQDDLARTRRRYVALGLFDPQVDVRELVESLMEEELIGYYDPIDRELAVRNDVARSLEKNASDEDLEWRATVVHELVHALQDQHLGLAEAMQKNRTTDADDAFGALVEGDATLAMLGYVADKAGIPLESVVRDPQNLAQNLNTTPDRITGALRAAPALVREPLLFRYRAGTLFSASLLAEGGWEAVNAAHREPPVDTLSVSDPARYRKRQAPRAIRLFDLSAVESLGYHMADEDVLGSLEMGVALAEAGAVGAEVSKAWRGDRYAILEHAGSDATVWLSCFASAKAARHVEQALTKLRDHEGRTRSIVRERDCIMVLRGLPAAALASLTPPFRSWAKQARADP